MSGIAVSPGASQAEVDAMKTQMGSLSDGVTAANTKADSAVTKADAAIEAGLTSADRQQAVRVQLTPDANGRVVFTYPKAYVAGIKPAVQTTAETPSGVSYRNDASIEEGSATNTQVAIIVQRIPKTITVSILGAVVSVILPVTTPVWLNIFVRAPV